MTLAAEQADEHTEEQLAAWNEPGGVAPRGTLVVIPGRGEEPGVYERFGRRLSADAYRVRAVTDPVTDEALAAKQAVAVLTDPDTVGPRVVAGSDTGALLAATLVTSGQLTSVDALILAGLPTAAADDTTQTASWDDELDDRTSCPTHRGRLTASGLRRGALYEPVPAGWLDRGDLSTITQPILAIHGADDQVSPLARARARYAAAPAAELVVITGGRHDALNDQTHRTVAATIVLFLERLRLGPGLPPIAVSDRRE
jgi:alpha-beta hydrolase superfamily lysophospholipase